MPLKIPTAPPSNIYKRRLLTRRKEIGMAPAVTFLRLLFNQAPCNHPADLSLSVSRAQIADLMQDHDGKAFNPARVSLGGPDHLLVFQEGSTLIARQLSGSPSSPLADDRFQVAPVVLDINRSCRPRDGEPFFLKITTSGKNTQLGIKKTKAATRQVNINGPDHRALPRFDAAFRAAFLGDLREEAATWIALVEKTLDRNQALSNPEWPAPLLTHGSGLEAESRSEYRVFLADVARYVARLAGVPTPLRLNLTAPLLGQDGTMSPSVYIGCGATADTTLAEQIAGDLIGGSIAPSPLSEVMPILSPDGNPIPAASELHAVDSGMITVPASNHQMMALMTRFQAHHRKIEEKSLP